jgi:hypothetical protein
MDAVTRTAPAQSPAAPHAATYDQGEGETGKPDLAKFRRYLRAYEANKRAEVQEAQDSRRYYHGKQWTDQQVRTHNKRGQPVITANRISRKIDFLIGVEQRMRRDPKAYARNPHQLDTGGADVATGCVRFVADVNRWEQIASAVAHDGMVSGAGIAFVGIETKRSGPDVVIRHVACDRFWYDSRSEKPDFSDAKHMGVVLWMDIDDAKAQWPDAAEQFDGYLQKDGGVSLFALDEDREQQWGDYEHQRVRVVEIWCNKPSGWEYAKFCGVILLESGVSPYLDEDERPSCPYVAWSPFVDEKGIRYGLVRNMRPVQDEINHRRSRLLYEIGARQMFSRHGSVDDIDATREEAAKADGLIQFNGEWGKDVGFVDRGKEIQGHAELLTESKSEIENYGPNPGLIGAGEGVDGASGRALLAQRDSGMTELSPVFDRLRDFKLRVYRKIWACVRQAWTAERFIRITDNPDAPQFIGLNQYQVDPMTGQLASENVLAEIDVDIILDEGPDTITLQEELMQTFANLGEAAAGPLGRVLIELSNAPQKERLLQMLDQATAPPPPDPLAQEAMMQELRGNEAKIEETQAKTAKTYSDIQTNTANQFKAITDAQMAREQPKQISEYGARAANQ